jgi:UDPglucose--hexose-1-phosphate uridylyltransferase
VIVAENRALRPNEFGEDLSPAVAPADVPSAAKQSGEADRSSAFVCPFCRGQEHRTPPAVFELADEQGAWLTRVVPNRFPAVTPPQEAATLADELVNAAADVPGANVVTAIGAHEVVIESPRHIDRLGSLSASELRGVLDTYARRLRHWRDQGLFAYGLVFKNQGARAGASLAHLHSQLIALPSVPPTVAEERDRAASDYRRAQLCPYCQLIDQERRAATRMICDADGYLAFCPFASLQPYEAWLLPERHAPFFEDLEPDSLDQLASVLVDLVRRVEAVVPKAAYNMLLRTSPWHGEGRSWTHWRFEILPRSSDVAGFELASGVFINPLAPERAASKLRSI